MAEGKKSFVLYADLLQKVDHLTNEELGVLFRHMLEYVNDKQPVLEDRLVLTAWKPIEVSLKEDLKRWEEIREKRAEAGAKGGRPQKAKKANGFEEKQSEAKKAVTVTVTDTVTDTVNVEEDKPSSSSSSQDIPTWEEWKKRWEEKGKDVNSGHCLQAFDYWESQDWKRNGKPIQNWKLVLVNNPKFVDCPKAQMDIYSEFCKANPPSDWIEMMMRHKWTKKEAMEEWRNQLGHRKDYYYPNNVHTV